MNHRIKMILPIRSRLRIAIIIRVMILRFLLMGFFSFFIFLLGFIGSLEALSWPLCSSKSKAWTGLRKSSAALVELGVETGVGMGVG